MNHIKVIILFVFLLIDISCSGSHEQEGLAEWSDVTRVMEDMLFRGRTDTFLKHAHDSDIPSDKLNAIKSQFLKWQGIPKKFKFERMETFTPDEFDRNEVASDKMRGFFTPIKWNKAPEKIVIFHFSGSDGQTIRYIFGAFRECEKWYFSLSF
jgi:hypothetical protein